MRERLKQCFLREGGILALVFCLIFISLEQTSRAQEYKCVRVGSPVEIDGVFDEQTWRLAHWVLLKRNDGKRSLLESRVALLWDDSKIYIGYDFQDPNILSTITTRDARVWIQDVAELFLTPLESERIYYEFQFSPLANWRDVVILHKGVGSIINPLAEWDANVRLSASISGTLDNNQDQDQRWALEVSIPFEDLWLARRVPPRPGDKWRVNIFRIDYGLEQPELSSWNPTLGPSFHDPTRFGTLLFVEGPIQ